MSFNIRTDLAIENLNFGENNMPKGIEKKVTLKDEIEITEVTVDSDEAGQGIGKPKGRYFSLNVSDFKSQNQNLERDSKVISEILSSFIYIQKNSPVLIVGLGNNDITPDALGPKTIDHILTTRHFTKEFLEAVNLTCLNSVCAIAPGVLGQTGIEVYEVIKSLIGEIRPSCVIVIDALAAKSLSRLANTVQISDSGICPGSGVKNSRKEISEKTLSLPVISIGIPMVIDISNIAGDILGEENDATQKIENMIVTPKEIDLAIEHASKVIGYSINRCLQPELSFEDLVALSN